MKHRKTKKVFQVVISPCSICNPLAAESIDEVRQLAQKECDSLQTQDGKPWRVVSIHEMTEPLWKAKRRTGVE
jgi:transposase